MKQKEKKSVGSLPWFGIPKLLPFLRPYGKIILLMIFCGILGSGVDILLPLFQQYAINHYIAGQTLDTLAFFILSYIAVICVQAVVNFNATFIASRLEVNCNRDLREASFNHLQTLSFSYFNQNSVGYIHSRIMSDTSRIGELVSWSLMDGVWNISYLIGAIVVMLIIKWWLALMVIAIVPLVVVLVVVFQGKLVKAQRAVREENSRLTGKLNEGITGAKTIKTLSIEERTTKEFTDETAVMKRISVHATRIRAIFGSIMTMASGIALAIVLWRGGIITLDGVMIVGTLSTFMAYAQGMMEPIRWLVDAISSLINTRVNIERLSDLLETEPDVKDTEAVIEVYGDMFHPKKENWEPLLGDITFRNVTFRYPDGEETVLENFNLVIPHGSCVAIVGETGAGKSTLVNLICRFYEPTEGEILIDDKPASARSQLWLHSHIGYVLQTPHLFSGSIGENLRYGCPEATDDQLWEALRLVGADSVVEKMPNGLDSEVGEGGDLLSTGEKQLISFARAFLADPRILILDEATASIDTLTEKQIQNTIGTMTRGRTTIMIAHRLSTVKDADCILVVKDGRIVEQGTHTSLLAAKGHYFHLYTRQFEEDTIGQVLS